MGSDAWLASDSSIIYCVVDRAKFFHRRVDQVLDFHLGRYVGLYSKGFDRRVQFLELRRDRLERSLVDVGKNKTGTALFHESVSDGTADS